MFCETYRALETKFGRDITGPGGFVPAGTKFDAIPTLRGGEQVTITDGDLYVMRGLFCGETSGYIKHAGKLSLGDAIATAKDSANLMRRMAVYEGCVDGKSSDIKRLPVMAGQSLLSTFRSAYTGSSARFYKRFSDVTSRAGAMSFPEAQHYDAEALWVLSQAQVYCRDNADRNALQGMISKNCQRSVDIMKRLNCAEYDGDSALSYRSMLSDSLSRLSDYDKYACEVNLASLEKRHPGKSARPANAIWTGLDSENASRLSNKFLNGWVRASAWSQSWTMSQVLPGDEPDLPVGCIRFDHKAFGKTYQSELPFYNSDDLKERARLEYEHAFRNGTMDKIDVVLPRTVHPDDVLPPDYSDDRYAYNCEKNADSSMRHARDSRDLDAVAANLRYNSEVSGDRGYV